MFSNGTPIQSNGKHDNGDNEFMADVNDTIAILFDVISIFRIWLFLSVRSFTHSTTLLCRPLTIADS